MEKKFGNHEYQNKRQCNCDWDNKSTIEDIRLVTTISMTEKNVLKGLLRLLDKKLSWGPEKLGRKLNEVKTGPFHRKHREDQTELLDRKLVEDQTGILEKKIKRGPSDDCKEQEMRTYAEPELIKKNVDFWGKLRFEEMKEETLCAIEKSGQPEKM